MACNRFFGSFSRHRLSSGRTFAGTCSRLGSSFSTIARMSETVSPPKSCLPVSSSPSTTPNAQMSARRSTVWPRACSGLIYAAVPMIMPALVGDIVSVTMLVPASPSLCEGCVTAASLKSSTLIVPSGVSIIFAGFRSRCVIPFSWAASRALNWKKRSARAGDYAAFTRQKGSDRRPIAEGLYRSPCLP